MAELARDEQKTDGMSRRNRSRDGSNATADPFAGRVGWDTPALGNMQAQHIGSRAGIPLDPATRSFMETRLSHDFRRVRVSRSPSAEIDPALAGARATTVGHHIVMGSDVPLPNTREGQNVLAHELAHVVQQQAGANLGGPPRAPLDAEREADSAAIAVSRGQSFTVAGRTGVTVARQGPGQPPISPLALPAEGVDMPWVGSGAASSELGYLRDKAFFWSSFQATYGTRLSPANRALIAAGRSPVVDATWVHNYPQHAGYLGEPLEHHHVGQGARAVPLPETLHDAYTVFHPQRRVVGTQAGGTRPLPPQPTRQRTAAEIRRHTQAGRIRGQGISAQTPPAAPSVPVASEVAAVPQGPNPRLRGTGQTAPRSRGPRARAAITTAEIEEDALFRRITRSSASDIAREAGSSTGRWARAARGLGKVGRFGLVALEVLGPIDDLLTGLQQIDAAKAIIDDIRKRTEEAEVEMMRYWGYEPVYRNGWVVDYVKVEPRTEPEPKPPTARTGPVYSLRGGVLIRLETPLSGEHIPITFVAYTGEGERVWNLFQARPRTLSGYVRRVDYPRLMGLARSQASLARLAQVLSGNVAPDVPEAPPPRAVTRARLEIAFQWNEGAETKTVIASCDNTDSVDGTWVATEDRPLDELRAVTERTSGGRPPDYEMFIVYQVAGGQSYLHVAHTASNGALEEDGRLPEGVLKLGTYPEDSGVNYIIENYWY
jgi:hypothetical protein